MARKKVRFFVRVNGARREVMSIVQGANGGLTINPRGTDDSFNSVPNVGDKRPVVERHISVHRSELSQENATTITGTVMVNGSEEQEFSALIKNSRENLLWPVYSFLSPDLRQDRYNPSKRTANRKVVLTDTDPEHSILIYHILALGPNREPPQVPQTTLTVEQFEFFQIAVYTHHVNLPSSPVGGGMYSPTRPPTVDRQPFHDDKPFAEQYPSGADSLTDSEAIELMMRYSWGLVRDYTQFWTNAFPNRPNPFALHRFRFSRLSLDI